MTRERYQPVLATVGAAQAQETEVGVATACEGPEGVFDPGVHGPVGVAEALVVDLEELLEVTLDDLLEGVGRGARAVGGTGMGGGRGHRGRGPGASRAGR
jgi:hypothetical protein